MIRAEINDVGKGTAIEKMDETTTSFSENNNKNDKILSSLRKKEGRLNLLNQKFKHEHYHQLYRNKKHSRKC